MASSRATNSRATNSRSGRTLLGKAGRMAVAMVIVVWGAAGHSTAARASGGGGGDKPVCIWEQNLTLVIDGHEIDLPQAVIKAGKVMESSGYYVHPDPRTLYVSVRGPDGTLYRAGLTVLELKAGRDSCLAYFAGPLIAAASRLDH